MSRPTPPDPWSRFLAAEAGQRESEAEAALAELFRALPGRRPRPGFSDRVLLRLAARPSWFARPAARLALAAALVVVAISAALLLPLVAPLAGLIGPGGAIGFVVEGFVGLATRFADGLAAWSPLATAARAVGRALLEPRLAGLLVLQFLIAALALRGLVGVVSAQRSSAHAAH
ncbi:MAG: hypothetical protein H6Q03_824 [Acidobacteria bacterium]|jgi:hypothetical protein|nr:hypothetical protein [Acidobacteriota bacterium]